MKRNVAKSSTATMGPDLAVILGEVSIGLDLVRDQEAIPSIGAEKPKETEREGKKNPKAHQFREVLRKIRKQKNIRIPEAEESALNTAIRGPLAKVKAEAKVKARVRVRAKARVRVRARARAKARAKAEAPEAEAKAKVGQKVKVKANQKNQKKKKKTPIIIRMRVAAKLRKKKPKTIKG